MTNKTDGERLERVETNLETIAKYYTSAATSIVTTVTLTDFYSRDCKPCQE